MSSDRSDLDAKRLMINGGSATGWGWGGYRNGTEGFMGGKHCGGGGAGFEGVVQGAAVVGDDREQHESGDEHDKRKLVTPDEGNIHSGGFSGSGNGSTDDGEERDVFERIFHGSELKGS